MDDRHKIEDELEDTATDEPRKPRKHGYRGYPNNPAIGGEVHTGTGFAGVGPGGSSSTSRESGLFTDKTQESVEEIKEEEEADEERKKK
jgi:hypothetical protein